MIPKILTFVGLVFEGYSVYMVQKETFFSLKDKEDAYQTHIKEKYKTTREEIEDRMNRSKKGKRSIGFMIIGMALQFMAVIIP